MQRIMLTAICLWLIVGAMPALAQAESESASPPPEQTNEIADDNGAEPDTWQYDDTSADADEDSDLASSNAATTTAAGVAAASALAMTGFVLVWFALYFGFVMFMMLFSMATVIATVLAIYDCAKRDFPDPNTRALWCILIVLTRWLGALIYYITVYRADDPPLASAVATRPTATPQT